MLNEITDAASTSVPQRSNHGSRWRQALERGQVLNDIHAKLNRTHVAEVVAVRSVSDVVDAIRRAERAGQSISVSGGRHAMGGQQFAADAIHLDMRPFNRVLALDQRQGTITVEAGIEWPKLISDYAALQRGASRPWGIVQKQTGADRLSIGGAVAANIHGRCLTRKPFVQDIVSLDVVDADGRLIHCSRDENRDLFQLVVGGYGLFGIVVSVTIQLARRQKVQRVVESLTMDRLMSAFDSRIRDGHLYGDFQFAIDPASPGFLHEGIFSCYRPVPASTPIPRDQVRLSQEDWSELIFHAHVHKTRAFEQFRDFYFASSGQVYWSDTHQSGYYLDDYHEALDRRMSAPHRCTEVISELYVPRPHLVDFMDDVRRDFRQHDADLIYGTIRLIERDEETFLNWASESFVCIIFNLHTEHTPTGIGKSRAQFQRLIDMAIQHRGSFFLTYHRFASPKQVLACYPQFPELLRRKKRFDPKLRFQSEWYRHYAPLFSTCYPRTRWPKRGSDRPANR